MFSVKPMKPTFKSYLPPVQHSGGLGILSESLVMSERCPTGKRSRGTPRTCLIEIVLSDLGMPYNVQGDLEKNDVKTIEPPIKKLEPRLLPGEIVVNEVNFVRKCISTDGSKDDLWGKLICTNFKVSFLPQDPPNKQKNQLSHFLLGEHDIPLTCLDHVVTVNDTKGKKKALGSNQKLKFNPTELLLYCKDLRIIRFCFDEAGPESAKKVCLAIAHYSHPADLQLLFGFEYQARRYHEAKAQVNGAGSQKRFQAPMFDRPSDLDREIKRTGASEWRVCSINEIYAICPSLPEYIVVPVSLADQDLKQLSVFFNDNRIPLWCWSHPNGSALVRMANMCDPVNQRKTDFRVFSAIEKSHPLKNEVFRSEVDKCLPNIHDIQNSFSKIRQMCVIDPFEESEERWLSSIENSRWLEYVRAFLKHSAEMVYQLDGKNVSVVLQEEEDRDLNCVVSSLVQLMLDPHYRSRTGFQSLVQKEWVMAGHRFLDRCSHLKKNDREESPLFMLFLDCVWQMMNQYPAAFEFSETYLTVLSDSMWIPLFSTFIFNSSKQRAQHLMDFAKLKGIPQGEDQTVCFPPVWDWSQQFSIKDQTLFNNPMYVGKGAAYVKNGEVKSFRRTKKYNPALRGSSASFHNGLRVGEDTLKRRGSFMSEFRSDLSQMKDVVESPSERYFREWFSQPVDQKGLLIPLFLPSHVSLWRLFFLRWVPEACISKGGSITAYHKLSQLVDEIEILQNQLRQYKGPSQVSTPVPSPCESTPSQRRMYFKSIPPNNPPNPPDFLTSSFPFTPIGNLCRRNLPGTPISKFLSGAKFWLSTETLANDNM